jgi:hypothetical protein
MKLRLKTANMNREQQYNETLKRSVNNQVWLYISDTRKSLTPIDCARKIYFMDLTGDNLATYLYMVKNEITEIAS